MFIDSSEVEQHGTAPCGAISMMLPKLNVNRGTNMIELRGHAEQTWQSATAVDIVQVPARLGRTIIPRAVHPLDSPTLRDARAGS
jgi:hypothetical protein